jgi:hypothetical protein
MRTRVISLRKFWGPTPAPGTFVYTGWQHRADRWVGGYYLKPSKWKNPLNKALKAGLITLQEALEKYLS